MVIILFSPVCGCLLHTVSSASFRNLVLSCVPEEDYIDNTVKYKKEDLFMLAGA